LRNKIGSNLNENRENIKIFLEIIYSIINLKLFVQNIMITNIFIK
jgi:hypothetical protein